MGVICTINRKSRWPKICSVLGPAHPALGNFAKKIRPWEPQCFNTCASKGSLCKTSRSVWLTERPCVETLQKFVPYFMPLPSKHVLRESFAAKTYTLLDVTRTRRKLSHMYQIRWMWMTCDLKSRAFILGALKNMWFSSISCTFHAQKTVLLNSIHSGVLYIEFPVN